MRTNFGIYTLLHLGIRILRLRGSSRLLLLIRHKLREVNPRLISAQPKLRLLALINPPNHRANLRDRLLKIPIESTAHKHGFIVGKLGITINIKDSIQSLRTRLGGGLGGGRNQPNKEASNLAVNLNAILGQRETSKDTNAFRAECVGGGGLVEGDEGFVLV